MVLALAAYLADDPFTGILYTGFIIYVFVSEHGMSERSRKEIRFLTEIDCFLGNLKHHYFRTGSIRDAVFFATDGIGLPLRREIEEISDILESPEMKTLGIAYQNSHKSRYLRILMSMIMLVDENGDQNTGNGSVFINAVMQLRMEVRDARRFMNNRRHKFMGLTWTAALPLMSVGFIAAWAADTNPNLLLFYYGRTGTVLRLAILGIGFVCYRFAANLKNTGIETAQDADGEDRDPFTDRIRQLKKSIKSVILFCCAGVTVLLCLISGHAEAVQLLKTDTRNIEMLCDIADGRQIAAMEYLIPLYTCELIENKDLPRDPQQIAYRLLEEKGIGSTEVASSAADEIIRRAQAADRERTDPVDLLTVLVFAALTACCPKLDMIFEKLLKGGKIKDEIILLQLIVSIQKDVPGIDPKAILETLESFSVYFKEPLRKCIDEYGICETEALEQLRNSCDNADFLRIVDCFIVADELGTETAFDEISSEIRAFREDRKAERTIDLENDVLLGTLAAILPGGIILFGYLLVPFMISALNLFNTYQDSLKDFISIT